PESAQRLAETLARLGAPPGPMQPAPEGEQRPGPLERHRPPVIERERGGEGRLEVVVDHAAAPGCGGLRDRAGGPVRPPLQPGEHAPGITGPALAGVGLDQVGLPRDDHRILQAGALDQPLDPLELADRRAGPVQAEFEEPQGGVYEPESSVYPAGFGDPERRPRRRAALVG